MKYWLNIPCKELSREWLLDEHMSVHAYFGGMLKNPSWWGKHSLIGPMDPLVMWLRHEEQVAEMEARGYTHKTPLASDVVRKVEVVRKELGISQIGSYLTKNGPNFKIGMLEMQNDYLKRYNSFQ